jgi:hypothetical protein
VEDKMLLLSVQSMFDWEVMSLLSNHPFGKYHLLLPAVAPALLTVELQPMLVVDLFQHDAYIPNVIIMSRLYHS